jgi:hypothetical protein
MHGITTTKNSVQLTRNENLQNVAEIVALL